MHGRGVLLAVAALALLAYALWEASDDAAPAVAEAAPAPVEPKGQPGPAHRRVVTYDGGRTTIAPKISTAAVARIRARHRGV